MARGQEASRRRTAVMVPDAFADAVTAMRAVPLRPEILCEEMPAPQRIAPYAFALSADVTVEGTDVGTGRIILLHDPAGNDAWDGDFRCVSYVRSDLEPEMVSDPMLGEVGWTWLTEALDQHAAAYDNASGTITRVATESFGAMAEDAGTGQIEVRASWTPDLSDPETAAAHVRAWADLLCLSAGVQPLPDGVAAMPSRRGQRGTGRP